MTTPIKLAFTPGDPAGIGPDLAVSLASATRTDHLVVIADRDMLAQRAEILGYDISLVDHDSDHLEDVDVSVLHTPCPYIPIAGEPDSRNSHYIAETLERAAQGCLRGEFDALVTGPVNKQVMLQSGLDFSGHTEYLAEQTGAELPVMLLMSNSMKVALVTTHVPITQVASLITRQRIVATTQVLHRDIVARFGIESPRIGICGLNPHAGEGGKIGREEVEEIVPAIETLRAQGIDAQGPYAADTIFAEPQLAKFDVVLAMYHDQGLPVIKHSAFGDIVNVTLGLPIVRTSVDHGTAYDIAGSGKADAGSLLAAINLACTLVAQRA